MKKIIILTVIVLMTAVAGFSQETQETQGTQETQETQEKTETPLVQEPETKPAVDDLQLGKVYFPKDFVHSGKHYQRGIYRLALTEKEGIPWFNVSDKKKEFLFEERGVVKPNEQKNKRFKYRIKKEMLQGYEFFRVKVIKPEKEIIAYFFVKKELSESNPVEKTEVTEPAKKKKTIKITH